MTAGTAEGRPGATAGRLGAAGLGGPEGAAALRFPKASASSEGM